MIWWCFFIQEISMRTLSVTYCYNSLKHYTLCRRNRPALQAPDAALVHIGSLSKLLPPFPASGTGIPYEHPGLAEPGPDNDNSKNRTSSKTNGTKQHIICGPSSLCWDYPLLPHRQLPIDFLPKLPPYLEHAFFAGCVLHAYASACGAPHTTASSFFLSAPLKHLQ